MVFVGERRFLEALSSSGNGIYNGVDPLAAPISLFFVQATIILGFSTFLGLAGFYLRSPKVIFEIIAGVLLGPSALCRDQWFKGAVFPSSSLDYLSLVANIGLTFYLFIIGIDLDTKLLMTHARKTVGIAVAGMAVPFAIGIAISQTMIDTLQSDQDTSFVSFFVFIGTAMSITAFPVLARILKEGGMIYTKPGAMTVGAAALNDAIAWCLLALAISLANGGSMNETGYIFGTMVGIAAFQLYIMRPIMELLVEYAESKNVTFITNNLFALTLCLLFMSAWFTELIGLDSIFGAFLFGLTIPRGSRLYRNCKDYIEQFVVTFTLPLYFTLSGLKTDVTLIRTGEQGAMIILVCFCATVGKFFGCGMAAILTGNNARESATIAVLMNTRGLVELIVLNVGLSAGILNTRTFSVMVIMCLFTTFITSPLVSVIYPETMRKMGDSDAFDTAGYHPVPRTAVNEGAERTEFSATTKRLGVIVESLPQMQSAVNLLFYFIPHTIGSEFAVTAMHFIEPTKTTRDEFLGLNAEGRLIRVDEEATDFFQAFQYMDDPGAKKPELLPITAYCKANHIPVNAFRIEGDAIEYPVELKSLATINECSLLCFPFRSHNQFARHLFWTSLYLSSSPILLLLPINATKSLSDKDTPEQARSREGTQLQSSDPEESDLMRTLSSPPLFTNLHKEILPRHRRNTVTNQFNKVEVSGLGVNQIVVLLVGKRADLTTISLLPRFIENPINEVVVLLPSDCATVFPPAVIDGLNSAKESLSGVASPRSSSNRNGGNIVWRELTSTSTDYEGLTGEVNELPFDLFVCSFIEPPPVDLTAAVSSRSARNNRTNTILDFVRANEPDHIDLRLQAGMPLQYVYSNLIHPELGIIGSKLYESAHFKASLVLIVHDPLPMNGRSASIVSDRTEQSQHTLTGVELPQVKPELSQKEIVGSSSVRSRRMEAVTEVMDEKDATSESSSK